MLEALIFMLAGIALVVGWQLFRYFRVRRNCAQDQQPLLHWGSTFHVLLFFQLRGGDRITDTARRFTEHVLAGHGGRLIYAGQAAFCIKSAQLGDRNWDGVLLFQFPSRLDYEECFSNPATVQARELFADSYLHGMRRNCRNNLAIPIFLLRIRLKDISRGLWRVPPLEPSMLFETSPELADWRTRVARLHALHEVNRNGLVVFNLVKPGSPAQQAADHAYGREMMSRWAALCHGPLHTGRSVALEGGARFEHVHIIQYPSARYFAELFASEFYQGIAVNKQPGDTIVVPTVPITEWL